MNGSQIARIKQENAIITLNDGTTLPEQQSHAVYLKVLTDLSNEKIAKAVGYTTGAEATAFFHSDLGQQALKHVTFNTLFDNAIMALRSQAALARGARSEQVRHLAAKSIMEMANLRIEPERTVSAGKASVVNIQINANDTSATRVVEPQNDSVDVHGETIDGALSKNPIKSDPDTQEQTGVGEK